MKKALLLLLSVCFLLSDVPMQAQPPSKKSILTHGHINSRTSGVFTYTLTTFNDTYNELTGATSLNNGEIWDDPGYIVPIGFTLQLNGNPINVLAFYGVGGLLAGPTSDPDIVAILAPFEMDLVDRGELAGIQSESPLSYKLEGAPGSRILKVEWKNAGSYEELIGNSQNMYINFQLWLYEGSNRIEFRFGENFIPDPQLFFGGFGTIMGLTDYNETNDDLINPHFLTGDINMPVLSNTDITIEGTPAEGTVYRLSLDEPVEVTVTGQNSISNCDPNGSATADASGGVEPYSYEWSNGAITQTISNLDAGTYSVTVTDADGSTDSGSVTITNVGPINPNASSTNETSVDGNDGTATSSAFGGSPPYTYEWSNGGNTQTITNLAPGLYTVTVTDTEGCTASQNVTVNAFGCPDLQVEASLFDATCFGICDGTITILDVADGVAPYTYVWSTGDNSEGITDLCAGDYSVTIIDANGCVVSVTYTVSQPLELLANAGVTGETAPEANDGTAWAAPSGGNAPYSYAWSTSSTDSLIVGLAPGSYTVTVTDFHSCTVSQTVEIDSFGCSLISTVIHNTCYQSCDGAIQVTLINSVGPVTYSWSTGASSDAIVGLCEGEYIVTATDAVGCVAIESYIIQEPPQLFANVGSTDETAPGANDGTAWAAPVGGTPPYTYEWSTSSTDSLITGLTPDFYGVIVTDAAGCADTQFVFVNSFPCVGSIETVFSNPGCHLLCNGTASVAVNGGVGPFTYLWSNGETTDMVADLCAGEYDVTITDEGQDCTAFVSFDLVAPDSLQFTIDQIIHFNDITAGIIEVTVNGGTIPYIYNWTGPNGFTNDGEDLSGLVPGLYTLVVTDANGCVLVNDPIEIRDETVSTNTLITVDVRIFPNPAKDQVYIDIDDITGFSIVLRSLDGRVISAWKEEKTLDVSSVPVGLYFLEGISGNELFRQRLVLAR